MKSNKLKFLFSLLFIIFLSFLFSFLAVAAERGLEVQYPEVGEEKITTSTTIEEYTVYIFKFSFIIAAIAAFAVLIYGGFRYVISAGNPSAMDDAKKWIWGGIIGLILLLCSWLILKTISPELLQPEVKPLKPIEGIYLINKKGEKRHYNDTRIDKIFGDFEAEKIEFISDKPADLYYSNPNKMELVSVFTYSEEYLGGTEKEFKNEGAGTIVPVTNVKSMFLLWHEPGIYLYEKENFGTPTRPKFYQTSQTNLGDFDNKTKSLRIVDNPETSGFYTIFLFEESEFNKKTKGKCGGTVKSESNLDRKGLEHIKGEVSSIIIFESKPMYGEVRFYDEIDCKGNVFKKELTGEAMVIVTTNETKEKENVEFWNSISINANVTVILYTNKEKIEEGYCRPFSGIGCKGNLKETTIYHECYDLPGSLECEDYRPELAEIFPMMK